MKYGRIQLNLAIGRCEVCDVVRAKLACKHECVRAISSNQMFIRSAV